MSHSEEIFTNINVFLFMNLTDPHSLRVLCLDHSITVVHRCDLLVPERWALTMGPNGALTRHRICSFVALLLEVMAK